MQGSKISIGRTELKSFRERDSKCKTKRQGICINASEVDL